MHHGLAAFTTRSPSFLTPRSRSSNSVLSACPASTSLSLPSSEEFEVAWRKKWDQMSGGAAGMVGGCGQRSAAPKAALFQSRRRSSSPVIEIYKTTEVTRLQQDRPPSD